MDEKEDFSVNIATTVVGTVWEISSSKRSPDHDDMMIVEVVMKEAIRQWCEQTIGYCPRMNTGSKNNLADMCLVFDNAEDAMLFRVKYGHYLGEFDIGQLGSQS